MHELLSFIGAHPILTVIVVAIITIGVCAHLSERLERKYGGRF
jgi:hypothetical protein